MKRTAERLMNMVDTRGWKGRIVSTDHLDELEAAIRDRYKCGLLDETLYRDQLSFFSFKPPEAIPEARSIIVVALPAPEARTIFHWKGGRLAVTVPPTYVGYSATTARVQAVLASWLPRRNEATSSRRLESSV